MEWLGDAIIPLVKETVGWEGPTLPVGISGWDVRAHHTRFDQLVKKMPIFFLDL